MAKIAVPQRGGDLFALAAPDQAIEHGLAGALAEIGVGDVLRDAPLDLRFQRDGELSGDALEQRDFVVGKSLRPIAEPGADDSILPDLVIANEKDEIVGAALGVKFLQHFEIEKRGVAGQPAAQHRQPMGQGVANGTKQKPILRTILSAEVIDNNPCRRGPVHRGGSIEGVEDPERHLAAQHRQSDSAQPPAQLAIERGGFGIEQRLIGQPLDDRVAESRRCRCLIVHAARL